MKGVVIKSTGSWYEVKAENGDICKVRLKGIFRLEETKDTNPIAVGDRVDISTEDGNNSWVINEIEHRKNYIVRSSPKHKGARQILAANIDQALLIVTMGNPRTSTGFIDRFLLTAEAYHIPTVIIFNKQDLLDVKGQKKQDYVSKIYENIGYKTLFVSALQNEHIEEVKELMKDKTSLISGHSGVGKSTLMNAVQPHLNLKTDNISRITGKGMHTTTFAEMHPLTFGGSVIDTPGIREFGIMDFKPEEISHYYVEMREVLNDCKFNNCLHEHEPGCAVKKAYQDGRISEERFSNYLNIMLEYKANYKHWE
ncbi:MAG TPA: ribosome small subunit-dependent GTPase A [Chitinophagales bacterium]|nr:ribosome small subunit-dependent GTPase A [Chitinophagales bacterium]HLP53161.1 ribosome small subunit-dependent GTPase A [Chitinophagales bacterium]